MLTAITLSVIVQWLFGRCARRNKVQSTTPEVPQEDEVSEDFEVVSEPEEVNEVATEEPIPTEVVEEATQEEAQEGQVSEAQTTEEPPSSSTSTRRQNSRGRKLYITKYGEKYHLFKECRSLKGYNSFEKEPCYDCHLASQGVLIFDQTQPTQQSDTELAFGDSHFYHHKRCTRWIPIPTRNRPVCINCEDEERILNYARNRQGQNN